MDNEMNDGADALSPLARMFGQTAESARRQEAHDRATLIATPKALQSQLADLPVFMLRQFSVGTIVVLERRIPGVVWQVGDPFVVVTQSSDFVNRARSIADESTSPCLDQIFGDTIVAMPFPVDCKDEKIALFLTTSGFFRRATDEELEKFETERITMYERRKALALIDEGPETPKASSSVHDTASEPSASDLFRK